MKISPSPARVEGSVSFRKELGIQKMLKNIIGKKYSVGKSLFILKTHIFFCTIISVPWQIVDSQLVLGYFSQNFVKIAKFINFPVEGVVSGEGVLTLAASGSTVHSEDSIS